jgi:hypothetical protein
MGIEYVTPHRGSGQLMAAQAVPMVAKQVVPTRTWQLVDVGAPVEPFAN